MIFLRIVIGLLLLGTRLQAGAKIELGADRFFSPSYLKELRGMRIGIVTNQTGVDSQLTPTIDKLKRAAQEFRLVAIFAPEHGLTGAAYAATKVADGFNGDIKVFSLHGQTYRPTAEMLNGIDAVIYDIQEIGCRSYTYATTLYYMMEECAKRGIDVIVLDRPNPINGVVIDGPMLDEGVRSFVGYINVPYCHGMTIGELAQFFNGEYKIGCSLTVVPMKGWRREMTYADTGLIWIPTSPQIPEHDSPLFYPMTGLLGELKLVDIGVYYTLPFKIVGAPWIHAERFANALNAQRLPGVIFVPFQYKPFLGHYKNELCQGVKIVVTDPIKFRPVAVDYLLIGILKTLYPQIVEKGLQQLTVAQKKAFSQVNGSTQILNVLLQEKYVVWKLLEFHRKERERFAAKRKQYLLY